MNFIGKIKGLFERKSADWGTLERYLAWAFGGGSSASGVIVNPNTAMQSAAVFACVRVLAESVGMLPLQLNSEADDGTLKLEKANPLWTILHDQPNDFQTSVEFFEMMVTALCLRGNAYAYVNRTRSGRIVELLPLHPDMVRCLMDANFRLSYEITMPDGQFKSMTSGEIFHVRGLTLNGWLGISPIAYARESIGLALASEKFGGQLFRNGAKMGGVLEHPAKMSKEAYDRLKTSFDAASSGENAHATALLEEGVKFTKISMSPEDSQFLDTRKYQRSEIASIFRVPAHLINDLEKATFSNIEHMSLEYISYSLMPWLNRIEKAIKRDLFNADEKKNLHVRFNVSSLLRGDQAARSAYYHNGILDGWLCPNEARRMESEIGIILNPLPELDKPMRPLNMIPVGQLPPAAQTEPAKPTQGKPS